MRKGVESGYNSYGLRNALDAADQALDVKVGLAVIPDDWLIHGLKHFYNVPHLTMTEIR